MQILCRKANVDSQFEHRIMKYMKILSRIMLVPFVLLLLSCSHGDEYIVISGFAQGGTYTVKLNLNGREGRVKPAPEEIRDSMI